MIDVARLTPAERREWDQAFPGGFYAGAPHRAGDYLRLAQYAHLVQTFGSGCVPAPIREALAGIDLSPLREYMDNVREAIKRGDVTPEKTET